MELKAIHQTHGPGAKLEESTRAYYVWAPRPDEDERTRTDWRASIRDDAGSDSTFVKGYITVESVVAADNFPAQVANMFIEYDYTQEVK